MQKIPKEGFKSIERALFGLTSWKNFRIRKIPTSKWNKSPSGRLRQLNEEKTIPGNILQKVTAPEFVK
ncbi:hypothetical protein KHM19_07510 [Leptospira borgpetersenii]|nr:hypothetical protein KHM09_13890 [Leptospira borgpetersenii]GIM21568.1 hypothetical protein KHM19_07510 [Leptospira borgpetersenii]GIM24826.1 hypothetical protein KHM25_07510 [Leptospira borgpetersenii]